MGKAIQTPYGVGREFVVEALYPALPVQLVSCQLLKCTYALKWVILKVEQGWD